MTVTTPEEQTPKRSLFAWIKDHPIVIVIGIIATAVGLGVTFTKLAYDAKIERVQRDDQAQISELKESLSNIQRNVGGDKGLIDVNAVLVDQDQASKIGRARYFPDESYYALADGANSSWTESRSNEYQLLADTIGTEGAITYLGRDSAEQAKRLPVRVWRKRDQKHSVLLSGPDGGTINLYPQVVVQRIAPDQILKFFPQDQRPGYAQAYQDEPTGVTLVQQLLLQLQSLNAFRAKLVSVQKKENVGYARYESRFNNVNVDGKPMAAYYFTQEIVVVSTGGAIYLIKTELPRPEPRSADAAWMTRWFNAFHIVSN